MIRLRRCLLLAALTLFAPCGTATAKDKYGPPWLSGQDARPEKVEKTVTAVGLGDAGDPIGVQVKLWGDVGNIQKGHTYRLMYQLRIQAKKGELGPLLGDAGRPTGVALTLATGTAGENWNGLSANVDLTRAALSAMTNLPKDTKWGEPLLLRVEPQLFDVTADKFVSEGKPNCLFLAVRVVGGAVTEVMPLPKWLSRSCGKIAAEALAVLDRLDAYDAGENQLQDFFFDALLGRLTMAWSDVGPVIQAIPPHLLASDAGRYLKNYLVNVARGDDGENGRKFDADMQAAAKEKLAEK